MVYKEFNVVVLSIEILIIGWYMGNEFNKLVINCVFCMGGVVILLIN